METKKKSGLDDFERFAPATVMARQVDSGTTEVVPFPRVICQSSPSIIQANWC
jgi:hypothetical protein